MLLDFDAVFILVGDFLLPFSWHVANGSMQCC